MKKCITTRLEERLTIHKFFGNQDMSGKQWEQIYAYAIDTPWVSSNEKIIDVKKGFSAYSAKTVKQKNPLSAETARIIKCRPDPRHEYKMSITPGQTSPKNIGDSVLQIWNDRFDLLSKTYTTLEETILIRSHDLNSFCFFNNPLKKYDPKQFVWSWNTNSNLVGYDLNNEHIFTWQPSGSQWTKKVKIPNHKKLITFKKKVSAPSYGVVLESIGYDNTLVNTV
jgi:hypothetical protein